MKYYNFLLLLFIIISVFVKILGEINFPYNAFLFQLINYNQNYFLNPLFVFFAIYGREYVWIPLVLILFIFSKTRKFSLDLVATFIIAIILGEIFKFLVAQYRPFDYIHSNLLISEKNDFSYPSGHALIVSTGSVTLLKGNIKFLSIIMLMEAIIVSYARIYVGVHWPIDVISGWLLGSWISLFYLNEIKKFEFIKKLYLLVKA